MKETLVSSLDSLQKMIDSEVACLLYFSSPSCNVCHALGPKIMETVDEKFPKIKTLHVDLSLTPEIGAQFQVLAAPTVILFLEGKEFIRKYRTMSVDGLMQEIQRPYTMLMES